MKYYYSKVFRVFYVRYITTNDKTLDTISPENQLFICRLFKKKIFFQWNFVLYQTSLDELISGRRKNKNN